MSEQKAAIERNGEATLLVVDDEPEIVALLDEYFTGLGRRSRRSTWSIWPIDILRACRAVRSSA